MQRILVLLGDERGTGAAQAAADKLAPAFGATIEQAADVEAVERLRPDLVVHYSAWQSRLKRTLFTADDWRLIRECRVPVLLVKDPTLLSKPRILVCVDPTHAGDKPAALDHQLLDAGEAWADALDGELSVLHVLTQRPSAVAAVGDAYVGHTPPPAGKPGRTEVEHAEQALRELLSSHPAAVERGRVRIGVPSEEIVAEALEQRASLVIMGAVARGRLERWIVGSTAEAALDRLASNVLVVKPARTAAAQ
jgi:universal stress protein E